MKCTQCGIDLIEVTIHYETGDVHLCPNHAGVEVDAAMELREVGECRLCDCAAVATIHDFKFDDERTRVTYSVCGKHADAFINRRLAKASGCMTFLTHDDFYDQESGEALQPTLGSH